MESCLFYSTVRSTNNIVIEAAGLLIMSTEKSTKKKGKIGGFLHCFMVVSSSSILLAELVL